MVSVTSMRFARRKLRYESWHLLHLYAYLGAGLALPHQLWTGSDFLFSPVATAYWWGLYGAVMLAVVVWRVIVPLRTSLRQRLRVIVDRLDLGRQRGLLLAGEHRHLPGLGVGARGRARRHAQDVLDHVARHRRGQKAAHRSARGDRGIDGGRLKSRG